MSGVARLRRPENAAGALFLMTAALRGICVGNLPEYSHDSVGIDRFHKMVAESGIPGFSDVFLLPVSSDRDQERIFQFRA